MAMFRESWPEYGSWGVPIFALTPPNQPHFEPGDDPGMRLDRRSAPALLAAITECSGGEWKPHWPETLPWTARTIAIGTRRGWGRGPLRWSMGLDEGHGPHLDGRTAAAWSPSIAAAAQ